MKDLLFYILFVILLVFISCKKEKINYASTNEILAKSHVKRMLVYESNEEEVDTIHDNLTEIIEFDTLGNKTRYLILNSYEMDTSVWDYFYKDGILIKEIGHHGLYPTEVIHEYDKNGLKVHSKSKGKDLKDIHYTYNKKLQLITEVGCDGFKDEESDSIFWKTIDSTTYHYKDNLLTSQQYYYEGKLFSDMHFETHNESGQCTKKIDYKGGKPEYSIENFYDKKGLLKKKILVDFYDDKKTYSKMIYEFYDL